MVWPALIVTEEEVVDNGLHLRHRLEPGAAPLNSEVLVEQRAVDSLDDRGGSGKLDTLDKWNFCLRSA